MDAIKEKRRAISDIEAAVRGDSLCQLALIAVKTGRRLEWDPKAERFVKDGRSESSAAGPTVPRRVEVECRLKAQAL